MILLGFLPIFAFGLGTWQIQRLKWKVNLIDELEEKLARDPISLPKRVNLAAIPNFIFRRVRLKGRWDNTHSILLGPRTRDGAPGFHLITPLVRSDGSTVIVDRGFVSQDKGAEALRLSEDGEVELVGMIRTSQSRNSFTQDNHPEKGEWYWADVDAIAEYAGGEKAGVQPVFIEEIFEGHGGEAARRLSRGIPIGRPPAVDIRNAHASYAVTWYSLSAFTTLMFIRLLRTKRQPPPMPRR